MINGFPFEGGQTTARKLRQTVTAYSEGTLQTALENGCKTMPELMAFLSRRDASILRGKVKRGPRVSIGRRARA